MAHSAWRALECGCFWRSTTPSAEITTPTWASPSTTEVTTTDSVPASADTMKSTVRVGDSSAVPTPAARRQLGEHDELRTGGDRLGEHRGGVLPSRGGDGGSRDLGGAGRGTATAGPLCDRAVELGAFDLDPLLLEGAAENRLNLVTAGPRTPGVAGGVLVPLSHNFTLWGDGWERPFDGAISRPEPVLAEAGLTSVVLRPECAVNRFVSKGTDLVDGRPWGLAESIVRV
ncbi:hypothetical protein GCM10007231_25450 [Nocardioides daphniae]|uniref:Uncharacterized protein n=1 Tax=Nocardioides daphniae TaxID=402297 RepID=A0ABQ1QG64_9ACTN|nr:hypothetical protein GCM10007231_25450 [Nocardioides daphniae]